MQRNHAFTQLLRAASALLVAACCGQALAQGVQVTDAWARATVQGQKASGVFMTLQSPSAATLVAVESPVAGVTEVHEMRMDGNVMQMRALKGGLALPASQAVALKPGGYHVMLMDLKTPLQKDTTIPLTLVLRDAKGVQTKTEVKVPVLLAAPNAAAGMGGMHH